MQQFKISIACCTYNGAEFLKEQLDSFLRQLRLPDELIICDDNSSDNTLAIIKDYKSTAPFDVKLYENNAVQLGSTKNFERAIGFCSGDIIVLSDQDDVWYPEKLSKIEKAFSNGAALVFSDADLVSERLELLGYSLFAALELTSKERCLIVQDKLTDVLIHRDLVTGAAAAFSKKHLSLILPMSENWVHDGWVAALISCVDKVEMIDEPLFQYRQHSKNQIGARKLDLNEKINKVRKLGGRHYVKQFNGFSDLKLRLLEFYPNIQTSLIHKIDGKINHLSRRAQLESKSISLLFTLTLELLAGNYHRFSRGWISYFRDVAMMLINLFNFDKTRN